MEIKTSRRSKYLIYPKFQLKFVGFLLFAILLAIFIFYLSQMYFIKDLFQEGRNLNLPYDHIYFKMVVHQEEQLKFNFLIASGLIFLFLLIFGLILSHRVAGPLVKLNNYIEDLSENKDPGELVFRKMDFFHEIPITLNKYLNLKREKGDFEFKDEVD